MSFLRTNHSFVSDLFNESVDLVHKTGLNDLFMNQNGTYIVHKSNFMVLLYQN